MLPFRVPAWLCTGVLLWAAACDRPAQPAAETPAAPVAAPSGAAADQACPPWRNPFPPRTPEWIQVARDRSGAFVQFKPTGVVRDPQTCEITAPVRLLYEQPQYWTAGDGGVEVQYYKEEFDFRFRCARGEMAMVGRRLLGSGERVAQVVPLPFADRPEDWRPIPPQGVAAAIRQPVCGRINAATAP
ncbi:MAG: hypothetical protein K2P95_09565 [Hyphomonadaceae bacterium]|nr:hypothetical protein [Hyphomonadaceae bacterium]